MTNQQSRPRFLSAPSRVFFVLLNLCLGLIPSLAFFAWIERNASLPYAALEWGWPWISLQDYPVAVRAFWNLALFLGFGFIHSFFAQPMAHRLLEKLFPAQTIRTVFMVLTGTTLTGLMGLWQNTGIMLWVAPFPWAINHTISVLLFWSFIALVVRYSFDPLEFMGIRQLYRSTDELTRTTGMPQLITTGIYSRVRHPIYFFTTLAILITPMMSLDRMILALAMALYLKFGIPLEERKLIATFGQAYEDYRARVPALLPRLR